MVDSKKTKKIDKSFHPFEVKIGRKLFPKNKGNKSILFSNKIVDDLIKLHDSEMKLNIICENVKSYKRILDKRTKQKRPINYVTRIAYLKEIDSFDVEYENFCMRVYNFRETVRNFVSEFLNVKAWGMNGFLKDSKIRELKIDKIFNNFNKQELGNIMNTRKNITHRINENMGNNNRKISDKINQQKIQSNNVTKAVLNLIKINDSISDKLSEFRSNKS